MHRLEKCRSSFGSVLMRRGRKDCGLGEKKRLWCTVSVDGTMDNTRNVISSSVYTFVA